MHEVFVAVRKVAARYQVSVSTVWRWASDRDDFPKPVKLAEGVTRWRIADLEAFETGLVPQPPDKSQPAGDDG